jgi:hypothetical protein
MANVKKPNMIVIGAGGFGVVKLKRGDKNCDTVVKFIKSHNDCEEGKKEFEAMSKVYEMFQKHSGNTPQRCIYENTNALTNSHYVNLHKSVYIPKPFAYTHSNQLIDVYGESFTADEQYVCAFEMEYVKSARSDKLQEHLILNKSEQTNSNSVFLVKSFNNSKRISVEQLKQMCESDRLHYGPRGVYLCKRSLQSRLTQKVKGEDVQFLGYAVGLLHGYIYAAGYLPDDVEIVIDKNHDIAMYDFGMVYKNRYNGEAADYDPYIPIDLKGREEYLRGVYEVLAFFGVNTLKFDKIAAYLLENADDADEGYDLSEFKSKLAGSMSGGHLNICPECSKKIRKQSIKGTRNPSKK